MKLAVAEKHIQSIPLPRNRGPRRDRRREGTGHPSLFRWSAHRSHSQNAGVASKPRIIRQCSTSQRSADWRRLGTKHGIDPAKRDTTNGRSHERSAVFSGGAARPDQVRPIEVI